MGLNCWECGKTMTRRELETGSPTSINFLCKKCRKKNNTPRADARADDLWLSNYHDYVHLYIVHRQVPELSSFEEYKKHMIKIYKDKSVR